MGGGEGLGGGLLHLSTCGGGVVAEGGRGDEGGNLVVAEEYAHVHSTNVAEVGGVVSGERLGGALQLPTGCRCELSTCGGGGLQ